MDNTRNDSRSAKKSREDAVAAARRDRESAAYAELAEMPETWNSWSDRNSLGLGSYRPF